MKNKYNYNYLRKEIEKQIPYIFDSYIMKNLNIGKDLFYDIVKKFNIKKYSKKEKLLNSALKNISYDDLYNYYVIQKHNLYQTRDNFNIGWDTLMFLLDYYKIEKNWDEIIATRRKNNFILNGSENYVNVESRINTIQKRSKERWLEIENKRKQTCLNKFGAESNLCLAEVRKQIENTCIEKYGVKNYSQTKEWFQKAKKAYINHYNTDWYSKTNEYQEKCNITRRNNNSFSTSKDEELLYKNLCLLFDEKDIQRNYQDNRYKNPINNNLFKCDFYITSLDLFIELNFAPEHGPHPFNLEDENDKKLLEKIRSKQNFRVNSKGKIIQNRYYNFEHTWTISDVIKLQVAKMNNLKYITLYTKDEVTTFLRTLGTII